LDLDRVLILHPEYAAEGFSFVQAQV